MTRQYLNDQAQAYLNAVNQHTFLDPSPWLRVHYVLWRVAWSRPMKLHQPFSGANMQGCEDGSAAKLSCVSLKLCNALATNQPLWGLDAVDKSCNKCSLRFIAPLAFKHGQPANAGQPGSCWQLTSVCLLTDRLTDSCRMLSMLMQRQWSRHSCLLRRAWSPAALARMVYLELSGTAVSVYLLTIHLPSLVGATKTSILWLSSSRSRFVNQYALVDGMQQSYAKLHGIVSHHQNFHCRWARIFVFAYTLLGHFLVFWVLARYSHHNSQVCTFLPSAIHLLSPPGWPCGKPANLIFIAL